MPSVADKLGFGPKRTLVEFTDGTSTLEVKPPAFLFGGLSRGSFIKLTADQTKRYKQWSEGGVLIQTAFPDLTPDDREIIMTGLKPEEFPQDEDEDEE